VKNFLLYFDPVEGKSGANVTRFRAQDGKNSAGDRMAKERYAFSSDPLSPRFGSLA
jgi:hypothetical protein